MSRVSVFDDNKNLLEGLKLLSENSENFFLAATQATDCSVIGRRSAPALRTWAMRIRTSSRDLFRGRRFQGPGGLSPNPTSLIAKTQSMPQKGY